MDEKNRGVSLVVIILSVIVVLIIFFFAYQQFFSKSGAAENINFAKTGNLTVNNYGTVDGIWFLVYEVPGNPALTAQLSFDSNSICKNLNSSCTDLTIGERVSIKGIEKSGIVLVREMQSLDVNSSNE